MDKEKLFIQSMEEVMHNSMMPYSEYVILERSLPRVEDGLKPVQRRILFAMNDMGITADKPHRKCARIVGEVLGKYHPHGDTSVYDALVRLAQPFNMGETLVDGHGNFGSIDGDGAAAMRYTEARMTPIADEMLKDIDKDTVPFKFNFDDSLKEPELLPCGYPNLLVNGANGIAVGFATNIPTHSLSECIDGVVARMKNPKLTLPEMMEHIKGPDFPTGGLMYVNEELESAYETGKGRVILRAKISQEKTKTGKTLLVITELPYQVNKAQLLVRISKLQEEKKELFSDISDIRDESDRTGMRAVIELKKDADIENTLNALYKYSDLQTSFSINMVVVAGGKPCQMGLLEIVDSYISHRRTVVTRRTEFELDKAKAREHILAGLMTAVNDIDNVIVIIKSSKTAKEAKERLMETYSFSEIQAQAVLDMRLQRLTSLQIDALKKEYDEVQKLVKYLEGILASPKKLDGLIIKEMEAIGSRYGTNRRTAIIRDENPQLETVVKSEEAKETVMCVYEDGSIKRMDKEDEDAMYSFTMMTTDKLYLLTSTGNCYTVTPKDMDVSKPKDKGVLLSGLFAGVEADEIILAVYSKMDEGDLYFYTAKGMIKRTACSEYITVKSKIGAIKLKDDDRVVNIEKVDDTKSNLVITRHGMSINFKGDDISPIGRMTAGVKAIKLDVGDEVIFARQVNSHGEIIVVSDRGYVKKTPVVEYDIQGKNGKGLKTFDFKANKSNGHVLVYADYISEPASFEAVQKNGEITGFTSNEVVFESRNSKGTSVIMVIMDNVVESCRRL